MDITYPVLSMKNSRLMVECLPRSIKSRLELSSFYFTLFTLSTIEENDTVYN